ncbi:MAG: hypothetical protein AB1545_05520 [Thermodesulfobacteriota bacterium]
MDKKSRQKTHNEHSVFRLQLITTSAAYVFCLAHGAQKNSLLLIQPHHGHIMIFAAPAAGHRMIICRQIFFIHATKFRFVHSQSGTNSCEPIYYIMGLAVSWPDSPDKPFIRVNIFELTPTAEGI